MLVLIQSYKALEELDFMLCECILSSISRIIPHVIFPIYVLYTKHTHIQYALQSI